MKNTKCTSCQKSIENDRSSSTFKCPKCGKTEITRCAKCRKTSVPYSCKCGFMGP